MWNLEQLTDDCTYSLGLCENNSGDRKIVLIVDGKPPDTVDILLETEAVPLDLLKSRNLKNIAATIRLTNGQEFVVDAHGIWFTEKEYEALRVARGDLSKVIWTGGRIPKLAPK